MSPVEIVKAAKAAGLNLIAISDHNSALHASLLAQICSQYPEMHCLYGMEVCSIEEVHNLCLFDNLETVLEFNEYIYKNLPDIKNRPEAFGDQVSVDIENYIVCEVDKYLGNAVNLSIDQVMDFVHQAGGLFIPAHIDRSMFSMTSQLGFLPLGDYDAVELSKHYLKYGKQEKIENLDSYQAVTNSDAHYLEDIGKAYNKFEIEEVSIAAIKDKLLKREWEVIINF
jgi:PHP family Zn ribbon phosphoesterase